MLVANGKICSIGARMPPFMLPFHVAISPDGRPVRSSALPTPGKPRSFPWMITGAHGTSHGWRRRHGIRLPGTSMTINSTSSPLRVHLADDHMMLRDRLAMLVDSQPDMRVIAQAASGSEAMVPAKASVHTSR